MWMHRLSAVLIVSTISTVLRVSVVPKLDAHIAWPPPQPAKTIALPPQQLEAKFEAIARLYAALLDDLPPHAAPIAWEACRAFSQDCTALDLRRELGLRRDRRQTTPARPPRIPRPRV